MGINYNTRAVTNGLVLNLDASNTKSYPGTPTVRALIVGGGGGGGMDMGGGGGGGGVIDNLAVPITPGGAMTVTVGLGGWGAPAGGGGMRGDGAGPQPAAHQFTIPATDGGNSSFGGLTAYGGGHGASSYFRYNPDYSAAAAMKVAGSGGSGGGMSGYSDASYKYGGKGTSGQGYDGGAGGPQYYSGGGGGAGGKGYDVPINNSGNLPHGGVGVLSDINGTSYYWGGGGGGASYTITPGGNGGNGGGGGGAVGTTTGGAGLNAGSPGGGGANNTQCNTPGGNAGANTGGGGGGGSHYNLTNQGGNGGSGIVIIRYLGPQNGTGGTVTTSGLYTVHTFTSSGTFTPGATWNIWQDTSTAGNHGARSGTTFNSADGGSIDFNGTTDKVTFASTTLLTGVQDYTVEAFIRRSAAGTVDYIFGNYGTANSGGLEIYVHSNNLVYNYISGPVANNTTLNANQWYCVTIVRLVTAVTFYLNGVADGSGTNGNSITTTNPFTVGNGHDYTSEAFGGRIACLRVYNRALSATEVKQNFNALRGRFGI